MATPINSPLRFGTFELDRRSGELRRRGHLVPLQPQPLEILRALLEQPGQVVTREELRRRLWRNGAYVDFDRSLNKAMVKLRDALGDDADSPRYIETLPRTGYRFIPLPQGAEEFATSPSANEAATASTWKGPLDGASQRWRWAVLGIALLIPVGWMLQGTRRDASPTTPAPPASGKVFPKSISGHTFLETANAGTFAPPPHSIAVLPFTNLGSDRTQEYLSDGLTEDLLDSLVRIEGLQVAGRTSSYYFKGQDVDFRSVARRLNVATVLEGSVRRSASSVRVTVHLTDAISGFTLWSATYDRDVRDVLTLQSEMAHAIAATLSVKLLGDSEGRTEPGGTRNPAAFDAYLRASRAYWSASGGSAALQTAIAGYTEAIVSDPSYALAYAARSIALAASVTYHMDASAHRLQQQARADASRAVALAPDLALAHLALGFSAGMALDFSARDRELERALTLAPGNERILRNYSNCASAAGRFAPALAAARRAVATDPLNVQAYGSLAQVLYRAGRYDEAIAAADHALALEPQDWGANATRGYSLYALGKLEEARIACSANPDNRLAQQCLAIVYEKLGRHRDAVAQLAKIQAPAGNAAAYSYAEIYAQWGDSAAALRWLDVALRLRHPWLGELKTDPLLSPLRHELHFKSIEQALHFPD